MRKVAKDKKSVSDVNHIVKKSNTKLSELQAELQELDSQLLVTQGNLSNSPLTGTPPPPIPCYMLRNKYRNVKALYTCLKLITVQYMNLDYFGSDE